MSGLEIGLEYKPNLKDVVNRHRQLWSRQLRRQILAEINTGDLVRKDPLEVCPDIPSMFATWDHNFQNRSQLGDDSLPVARVSFGSAAFAAFLGAEITFDGSGGWCQPYLASYKLINDLKFNPENYWIQHQMKACQYFMDHARYKFAVCETEPIDGMNFVEALRGSAAYTDVIDYPNEVHRLLEFSLEYNIHLLELQRKLIAPVLYFQDGLFSMFRIWLPGEAIWMSVDAYGNCSPRVFREFGAPYLQRAINHFGGGWIHLHSFATHLIPEIIHLNGVLGLQISDDPHRVRGFEKLKDIRRITGEIPLQVDCNKRELEVGMADGTLPGNTMYVVKDGVKSVNEANLLMERVRNYVQPT